eukprot:Mrub_12724.p1 GENE.Mrub_12724~~Mrub_12724.p1  ORF type:complete len:170 (-),score=17.23 Mrub_12724:40-501(-)
MKLKHSYRFGTFAKFYTPRKLDINFDHPDYTKVKESPLRPHFTLTNHSTDQSYCKEKERYLTCKYETANYNTKDTNLEVGGNMSKKYTMSKSTRACNKVLSSSRVSPGPSDYISLKTYNQYKNQYGKFPSEKRYLKVKLMDRYFTYGMKTLNV